MMSKKLYIIGAGSVGGHIAMNYDIYGLDYELCGFFDDDIEKIGVKMFGYPVLGPSDEILDLNDIAVVIGIALPVIKKRIYDKFSVNNGIEYPELVSSNAWVSHGCSLGKGCIIYPGCAINYGTIIGEFVVMNMNCAVGHDCRIGSFSSLAPGVNLAGHTEIKENSDIGIGTSTRQDVVIGKSTVLGGQSMVTKNIPDYEVWGGVPAKFIKRNEKID